MNIIKENIYMNRVKGENTYQITLDDDFIIGDNSPDIDKIIREQGEIIIDDYKVHNEKVDVRGKLKFVVLYLCSKENAIINSMVEEIPFDEIINVSGVDGQDNISIKGVIEDLTVNIINSRKISAKSLLSLNIVCEDTYGQETAVGISEDDNVQIRKKSIGLSQMAINKKDIYRIKDSILLQSSKKNINEILYYDVSMMNCNTRFTDERVLVKGDLAIFILYSTEDNEYECIEKEIPYSGEVQLYEAREGMLDDIEVVLGDRVIIAKPDDDGEKRIIDIDVMLNLNIKAYTEGSIEIISDIYSINKKIRPLYKDAEYETLLLKNNTLFRINDKIEIKNESNDILQICNSTAIVKIDESEIVSEGILVEGVAEVNVIYISSRDNRPLNSFKEIVPFSHMIEVPGIKENSIYSLKPYVEQISVTLVASTQMEVKIGINVNTTVFNKYNESVITDIVEEEISKDEWDRMPSMIGYLVKDGDSLWNIAKKFYTTVDMLKKDNSIVDNDIKKGDKLLIIKRRS